MKCHSSANMCYSSENHLPYRCFMLNTDVELKRSCTHDDAVQPTGKMKVCFCTHDGRACDKKGNVAALALLYPFHHLLPGESAPIPKGITACPRPRQGARISKRQIVDHSWWVIESHTQRRRPLVTGLNIPRPMFRMGTRPLGI